jgi:hypothetical protein
MSGREVAVAAGLVIIAIGALSEAANHPAQHATPRPVPTHTVVIHQATTHVVTKLTGSPVNGLEITLMVIVGMLVSAGVVIALHSIGRQLWPSMSMTCG